MLRVLVLIALVVLAVWLLRRALARPRDTKLSSTAQDAGELVRCAHCGVHLPRSEARSREGVPYCSDEHARLGRR